MPDIDCDVCRVNDAHGGATENVEKEGAERLQESVRQILEENTVKGAASGGIAARGAVSEKAAQHMSNRAREEFGELDFTPLPELKESIDCAARVENADGSVADLENGRAKKITYPNGATRHFEYDKEGRLSQVVEPGGAVWSRTGDNTWESGSQKKEGVAAIASNGFLIFRRTDGVDEMYETTGGTSFVQPVRHAGDFKRIAEKNFSRIDKDGDGSLTADEIDFAVQDKSLTGEDAQMVSALKKNFDQLSALKGWTLKDIAIATSPILGLTVDNRSVSMDEILKFDQIQNQVKEQTKVNAEMELVAGKSYDQIDKDGDGFLTAGEIDAALTGSALSPQEKHALEHMRLNLDKIEGASNDEWGPENDGITRKDIAEYIKEFNKEGSTELVAGIDGAMDNARGEVQRANRDLFADKTDPLKSIRPEAIRQGGVGDCYFMCALASLAQTNPQAIKDMIKDNGDGTFTVTFAGAADEPITISAPTDQELQLYAGGSEHGMWAAVVEKAYGQYRNNHKWFFEKKTTPSEGGDGGGLLHDGMGILTGKSVDTDVVMLSTEEGLEDKIKKSLAENKMVTCGTARTVSGIFGGDDSTADGLPGGHAYSVLAYDPETRLITIRNPWGHGEPVDGQGKAKDGADDGVFQMTIQDFKRNFMLAAFAEK